MPPWIAALPSKIQSAVKETTDNIIVIYSEKGLAPFKRPLMIAAASLLALYLMVYSPISEKLNRYIGDERNMKAVTQYAGDYENARTRVAGYQRKLPPTRDKDDWINRLITDTASNAGVSVDSLGAQRETEVGGYLLVFREVTAVTTYGVFGKWLAEIENYPVFLRITEMTLHRDENTQGAVKVTFTLCTAFPREGGK